jgi:hypothetical protein
MLGAHRAFDELLGMLAHRDRAGGRERLHPRRETGRMRNRSVLSAMLAGLDRAHHHLAGVQPDANLDRRAPLLAQLACVALDVLLHLERREQGPLRMILVRDRRPEQREDPVTG